ELSPAGAARRQLGGPVEQHRAREHLGGSGVDPDPAMVREGVARARPHLDARVEPLRHPLDARIAHDLAAAAAAPGRAPPARRPPCPARVAGGPCPSRPRTRAVVPRGSTRTVSPAAIAPATAVPVTTTPWPRITNARSTGSRKYPSRRASRGRASSVRIWARS